MVGKYIRCHVEPELGHLRKHRTLLGHFVVEDDIETAYPVGCYHYQAVAVVVDLTDFSFFDWL